MDNSIICYQSDELQNPSQVEIENGTLYLKHLLSTELFITTKYN